MSYISKFSLKLNILIVCLFSFLPKGFSSDINTDEYGVFPMSVVSYIGDKLPSWNSIDQKTIINGNEYHILLVDLSVFHSGTSGTIVVENRKPFNFDSSMDVLGLKYNNSLNRYEQTSESFNTSSEMLNNGVNYKHIKSKFYYDGVTQDALVIIISNQNDDVELNIEFYPDFNHLDPVYGQVSFPTTNGDYSSWSNGFFRMLIEPMVTFDQQLVLGSLDDVSSSFESNQKFIDGAFTLYSTASNLSALKWDKPQDIDNWKHSLEWFDQTAVDLSLGEYYDSSNTPAYVSEPIKALASSLGSLIKGDLVGLKVEIGHQLLNVGNAYKQLHDVTNVYRQINSKQVAKVLLKHKYADSLSLSEIFNIYGLNIDDDDFDDLAKEVAKTFALIEIPFDLDNIDTNEVKSMWDFWLSQAFDFSHNRAKVGNIYLDVDSDGVSNINEISNNTDPNAANFEVFSFYEVKYTTISTTTGEITGLINSSFDEVVTGLVTFSVEGTYYSTVIYEEDGEYKFKKTINRPINGQSVELFYEPTDANSITWFVYVYAKDGVIEDIEYSPLAFRVYPNYSTNYLVGETIRFKVRGVDSDSNLSHVIWSFDGPIKLLESDNRDDFEDGHEDTESMEIEITGDNGGSKFYLYATTYDDLGNASEPLKWVLEARPNFSPVLTPIYPATAVVDITNLGDHDFLIDVFDQDDNSNDILWYLDGELVDTSGTGGGEPKTQEKGDIYFDARGVYQVKAVVDDDDGNSTEYIWTVNAGTITDGNLSPVLAGEPYLDDEQPQYTIFRVNHNYQFKCTATDADINLHKVSISLNGQLLHESVDNQFDDDRRTAYYDITFPSAGDYTISCFAIDAEEKTANSYRTITVIDADEFSGSAPVLEIYPTDSTWTSGDDRFYYYGRVLDVDFDFKELYFYLDGILIHKQDTYGDSSFDDYIQDSNGVPTSGTYTLKIVAVDANGNKSNEIIKTIKPSYAGVTSPLIFKALPADSSPIKITQAAANDGIYLYVYASDPDNDLDTIEWDQTAVGSVKSDLITPDYIDSNNISSTSFDADSNVIRPQRSGRIYAKAKDDGGRLSSSVYWDIEIVTDKVNVAPKITNRNYVDGSVSVKSSEPNEDVTVEFDVFDNDGDLKSVIVSINGTPVDTNIHFEENFVFDDECSLFTKGRSCDRYSIDFDYRGEQVVFDIVVEDYAGNIVTETFTVIQGPYDYTNHAPSVTPSIDLILEQRTSKEFALSITDEEGDVLSFTVDSLISGHKVESISDTTLLYTPTPDFYGTDSLVIHWDDGFGGTAQTTLNVTVNQVILPPKLSITQLDIPYSDSLINIGEYIAGIVYSEGYADNQLIFEIDRMSGLEVTGESYLVGSNPISATVIDSNNVGTIRGVVKDPEGQSSSEIIIYIGDWLTVNTALSIVDTDSDGTRDIEDLDDDNDGMSDAFELASGLDPLNASDAALDSDNDGLTNLEEFNLGTNPTLKDTDGDGTSDYYDSSPLDDTEGAGTQLDINSNDFEELAIAGSNGSNNLVSLLDTYQGSQVGQVSLPSWFTPSEAVRVKDINGNGVWDMVVLGATPAGAVTWMLYDGKWKNQLYMHSYPNWLMPTVQKQASPLPDINGNNRDELVLLIERNDGRDGFAVYDLATRELLKALWFPGWFNAEEMLVMSDWTGNDASELVIYGKTSGNKPVWLKYDSLTGANLGQGSYPGWFVGSKAYKGSDLNSNGTESIITLGETTGGAKMWIAQDARSGTQVKSAGYPGWLTPSTLTIVEDPNGDDMSDVATLGQTSGGFWLWRLNDVMSNAQKRQKGYPGWFTPLKLNTINDINGNDEVELSTYGRALGGSFLWLNHDSSNGAEQTRTNLPAGFTIH